MDNSSKKSSVPAKNSNKAIAVCFGISVMVIGLYFIPYGQYVLYPFMLIYTFIHEMGHGIMAELVGGDFVKFEMWVDGSGVASNATPVDMSRIKLALIAFGGLIAPAVIAAISLVLGRSGRASRIGMALFGLICVLSLIFVVRNLFGFFFVLGCGIVSFLLAFVPKSPRVPQYSMLVLAITLLTAVFSRGDYLFTDTAQTAAGVMPSDVGQIARNLFLPYWFWGGLIALISVLILILGIRGFFIGLGKEPVNEQKKITSDE